MSPFLIFVTVLTIGYVIYYAVIIMQDLYGKKGEPKEDIEEFEVSTMAGEESPIVVNEDGTNFKVGNDEDNESEQRIVVYDEWHGKVTRGLLSAVDDAVDADDGIGDECARWCERVDVHGIEGRT